jgi:hypothetical protein
MRAGSYRRLITAQLMSLYPWHNRKQMAERKFEDVQRELDDTVLNLKATTDRELKRPLLQKMRRLLEEADRLLNSKH